MVFKIFKSNSDKLTEIKEKEGSKPFKDEKEMQKLVEKNVDTIFPGVEFVESEFSLLELRIDTVCFNKETNSFVIIEYKNDKHGGVIDQGMAYLDLLETNREAFLLLYQKQKKELLEEVNWEETKIIIIAPEYTPHQLRASSRTKDPIELWKIKRFQDETYTLEKIHDKEKRKKAYKQDTSIIGDYSEEDYLAGKYYPLHKSIIPTEEGRKLFKKMKNRILEVYPNLESQQRSKYVGFYSINDGSSVCSITVAKSYLDLGYATSEKNIFEESDFVRYMIKPDGKKTNFWGLGNYLSRIHNESDIEKAIQLLQKVYDIKVK